MKIRSNILNNKNQQCEENDNSNTSCCSSQKREPVIEQVNMVQRRDFIKVMGLGFTGLTIDLNHPLSTRLFQEGYQIPIDKDLDPEWVKSLYERGTPETYTGKDLVYIGMPVGGICAGQVYLGGDGKLWLWDIFNDTKEGIVSAVHHLNGRKVRARDGSNYIVPVTQEYPFDQGFAIKIQQGKSKWSKRLDYKGFKNITFKGQYPIGEVIYEEGNIPVQIKLKAYSPFIPLEVASSNYPATVMHYTVKNTSDKEVSCELSGWLENPVLNYSGVATEVQLKNTIIHNESSSSLLCEAVLDESGSGLDFEFSKKRDYGDICLTVLDMDSSVNATSREDIYREMLFPSENEYKESVTDTFGISLRGGLSKTVTLEPGESKEISFVISWYFPNLRVYGDEYEGRSYSNRFKNSLEVAQNIVQNFERLHSKTLLFVNTFYNNSTLPYWFLNRTFANTSTLATETCYLLEDGRFWAWEGIGCCPGTCTHVWHYAQAVGRVFPELERNLRERTDFSVIEENGKVDFRGGLANRDAADGQAGIVLRSYREHQMTSNENFLNENWKNIRATLNYLIEMDKEDGTADGMIYGEQHNTLDAEWYGNIPVITSLYLAALAAGKEMATEMGDLTFANLCSDILKKGQKNIEVLFNGEYFIQNEDPKHEDAIGVGTGCYIDQVFGQSWAFQLGLGRLYNEEMIQNSLDALWKYNFVPNMGDFRESLPEDIAGRPYAIDMDAGLVMCTWPKGGKKSGWEKHWQFGYFNECMTGFEYEVAGHMIWEGKVQEGLAITRAIHDRYDAKKRNPYNEIECSDHYARAMASYGVYIAACGFEYHGPKMQLKFAPKLTPENFQAGFIAAEGWGTFTQRQSDNEQFGNIEIVSGQMTLKQLSIALDINKRPHKIKLRLNDIKLKMTYTLSKTGILTLTFKETLLKESDVLSFNIRVL